MAQELLDQPDVDAIVDQSIPGTMAQHVGMQLIAQSSKLPCLTDDVLIASTDSGPPRSVSKTQGPLVALRILRSAERSSLATVCVLVLPPLARTMVKDPPSRSRLSQRSPLPTPAIHGDTPGAVGACHV
jgi:hypothetical protein